MTDATTTPNNATPEQNPTSQKADQKNVPAPPQADPNTPSNAADDEFGDLEEVTTENQNVKSA